ncbi:3-oxoacyl-[acyl-carrier-protein] synthase [Croceitalea dokdonensis DOKDO 023]|uniref:3-oxoacyl-[acyl-carrier-protein] synthase n=2 Tax=Croceitalea TaxID=574891 RepID=A0A0P7AH71_9FLAO|nr:3-oxoacyl-[acyl-carrier-protein] synthase [Croceitalea dokdonensis DOKDO 023]
MLNQPISITALASISPLGCSLGDVWEQYLTNKHLLSKMPYQKQSVWAGRLSSQDNQRIISLSGHEPKYQHLDRTVLFALFAARRAVEMANWKEVRKEYGINIGSSRGATALFEQHHAQFLEDGKTAVLASPTTTLGNISSWLAHDLQTHGPTISHSITCSTALHALLNGVAWLQSGLAQQFLVGGSEAPLTPFTIAQMQALKIYAKPQNGVPFPCRALDLEKSTNTMVLGEGAAMACLEVGQVTNRMASIVGIGYATEPLRHNVSISADAQCFQDSMKMALKGISPGEIDVIVMHAPGTIKGDVSEMHAIEKVFCNKIPFLTTNKWKVGHTFGTSGMLSVELAVLMLQHQKTIHVPYTKPQEPPTSLNYVMVNAVGFGGNAVSVLLSK